MRALALAALVLAAPAALAAYELNGVPLGGNEAQVKKAFPSARCKPLEWSSRVADRRCDDAKIAFGGVQARLTVYLRSDSIQAFSVRFDVKDRDRVVAHFKSRWGPPSGETSETIARKGKDDRRVSKLHWEKGNEHAMLIAQGVLALQEEYGSFARYLWQFVDGKPLQPRRMHLRDVPARTEVSDALSADLKRRGFKFTGSTIMYAFMQSVGMVDDHVVGCFRAEG